MRPWTDTSAREWNEESKWVATGRSPLLRQIELRCSTKRSPSLRPVSPMWRRPQQEQLKKGRMKRLGKGTEEIYQNSAWISGMDDNYNILPHGVNFQDAIFPDTTENRKMFSSLFQFSNCTQGQQLQTYTADWEIQEDHRLMCSTVQKALFEEEERVKKLVNRVAMLESRNKQLKDKVKRVKHTLRRVKKNSRHVDPLNRKLLEKASSSGRQNPHFAKPDSNVATLKG